MLDLLGRGYVADCCISTANFRRSRQNYETYMADAAYVTMNFMTNGKADVPRYYDLLHPKKEDKRSGEEIAADIIKRHGLKVVG